MGGSGGDGGSGNKDCDGVFIFSSPALLLSHVPPTAERFFSLKQIVRTHNSLQN